MANDVTVQAKENVLNRSQVDDGRHMINEGEGGAVTFGSKRLTQKGYAGMENGRTKTKINKGTYE